MTPEEEQLAKRNALTASMQQVVKPATAPADIQKGATAALTASMAALPPTANPAATPGPLSTPTPPGGVPGTLDMPGHVSGGASGNGSSFDLTPEQLSAKRRADEAYIKANGGRAPLQDSALRNPTDNPNVDPYGVSTAGDDTKNAKRRSETQLLDAQSQNAGVQRTDQIGSAAGIDGFFGGKTAFSNFTAGPVDTGGLDNAQARIDGRIAGVDQRATQSAQAAQSLAASSQAAHGNAATLDQGQSNQVRGQQQDLGSILMQSAKGQGPSAAQAQLQAGTDQALSANLALARSGRGGNQAQALKNALMQNGTQIQQSANESAALKAHEQQAAQSSLGGVLQGTRDQDLGAATTQAGYTQQTNLSNAANDQATNINNAGFQQQTNINNSNNQQATNIANLNSSVEQQKQKDSMIAQLIAQGLTADQAKIQAETQQKQFNAQLMAQQEAARNGQTFATGQQQLGALGTGIATAGSIIGAAVSDRRAKKNITDGEDETREFLAALRPHGFEYKDGKFGEGHHLGVMAQDVQRGAPELVIDDTDGIKKLDIRKALSASLASLGSLDKRLSNMETKRGR